MPAKTQQLQIRVTPRQKVALKRLADAAGVDVSHYVLARVLPALPERFAEVLRALEDDADRAFAFAELNDFLHGSAPAEFGAVVARATLTKLSPYVRNYVAAMVEQAAGQKRVAPPPWVREITPLAEPHFATPFKALWPHLLLTSPVPFKRRNIFVDSGVGARV